MNQFHLKSVLLGIGIGIIITAIVSMIYIAGRNPLDDLTKEQIINQAEKYGMIRSSILQNSISPEDKGVFQENTTQ